MKDLVSLSEVANRLGKALLRICSRAGDIGAAMLMAIMLLTVTDVTLRRAFNAPLQFSYELTCIFLVIVVFFSIAHSTSAVRHVTIDVLVPRFPRRAREMTYTATNLISAVILGVATWRSIVYAMICQSSGIVTGILRIPLYPFSLVMALGCALASVSLLVKAIESTKGEVMK